MSIDLCLCKRKPYYNAFKSAVTGLLYKQTYSSDFKSTVIDHLQKKNSKPYYNDFENAVIDHLQKKKSKPYSSTLKVLE